MRIDSYSLYSYKDAVSAFKHNISHELKNYFKNKNILINSINCDNPCDNDMDIYKYGIEVSVNIGKHPFVSKISYCDLFNCPLSTIIDKFIKKIDNSISSIEKIKEKFHISNDFLKNKIKTKDDVIEAVKYDLNQLSRFNSVYRIIENIFEKVIENTCFQGRITVDNPLYYKDPSIYIKIKITDNKTFTYRTSFTEAIHTGGHKLGSELIYNLDKFMYPGEIKRLEEYYQGGTNNGL